MARPENYIRANSTTVFIEELVPQKYMGGLLGWEANSAINTVLTLAL